MSLLAPPCESFRLPFGPASGAGIRLALCLIAGGLGFAAGAAEEASLRVDGERILAETGTLKAVLERGVLVSLIRKSDGRTLVEAPTNRPAVGLLYPRGELVSLGREPGDRVQCSPVNQHRAECRIASWNGDAVVSVSVDPASGDLVVEPSAHTSRPGLRACRWTVWGIQPELDLVAPFFQGLRTTFEEPLVRNTRWNWPMSWEAGLVIAQGSDGGFWAHCQDTRYRYKALQVGTPEEARALGFDTEAYGPTDANLAAGGLAWRINVHSGDWTVPAGRYRDWLTKAYDLGAVSAPDWVGELQLAVSWCPTEPALLDVLARRVDPRHVLLHVPNWRSDPYDENYPTYQASPEGRAFMEKAQAMGYHVMPHANSVDMDPTHPVYAAIRDFQYRNIETKQIEGWVWHDGRGRPVPESNAARLLHRDKKTMVKIHPGLAYWRSVLVQNIRGAAETLSLEAVFLDVTLTSWNLHNAIVDYQTSSEGMLSLEREVGSIGRGLVVGGEGRNEVTMQGLALGQVHLFKSWQENIAGFERLQACPVDEFLFGRWCRSFGYSGLDGATEASRLRLRRHVDLGAIPTFTVGSVRELESPNPAIAGILQTLRDREQPKPGSPLGPTQ